MSQADTLIVSWLKAHAVPLTTLDPQAPLDDLAPFVDMVGAATLVGLGEASHGAHECLVVKHRLLRLLVERLGFSLLAVEMDWMSASRINEYVLNGVGEARALLKQNGYWFHNTREMLGLIEWLRVYNADPQHQKVRFAGFDAIGVERASLERIVEYVRQVDNARAAKVAQLYQSMAGVSIRRLPAPPVRHQLYDAAHQVSMLLTEQAHTYVARSSPSAFAAILQEARIVEQATCRLLYADTARSSPEFQTMAQVREQGMTENVCWLHEQAEGGEKIALWAHNWHIGTWGVWHLGPDKDQLPFRWMGIELRQRYHEHYVAVGFSFVHGQHNAIAIDQEGRWLAHPRPPFHLAPARDRETYHVMFAEAGQQYLLDLRAPAGEAVRTWLAGPHPFRVLNDTQSNESDFHQAPLLQWFDVLIHIEQISPSHLLPKGPA